MAQRYSRYSRLTRVEEKKAVKSTVTYVVLTIVLLIALLFIGLPGLSKFAGFLIRSLKSDTPITISDKTPPAPPILDAINEHTKESDLRISGTAEAGSTVTIITNGKEKQILADNEGSFSTDAKLQDGENSISAKATDKSGNESVETRSIMVNLDTEPPKFTIEKPANGSKFSGSKQRQTTVEGTTDQDASLTVNDRIAIISGTGKFSLSFNLNDGENTFVVKAKDQAGNEVEETITVTYTP